ncbi:MAG: hypothetical protein IKJ30_04045 [Bacilli bacterium]|nr:hypothetical protein [Bacilli bacterium]
MIPREIIIQIKKEILNKINELPINAEFRLIEFLDFYELDEREELEVAIDLLSELMNFNYCEEVDIHMDVSGLPKNILLKKIK